MYSPIHVRLVGQIAQILQALPKLPRGALEHPPASQGEQSIAAEQLLRFWKIVRNVPQRMSADVHNLGRSGTERHRIALCHRHVDAGNLLPLVGGSHDRHLAISLPLLRLEIEVPARVIVVVMRVEHVRELPTPFGQLFLDGRRAGRIDCGGLTCRGIVQEVAVVVVEAGELHHLEGGGRRR